MSNRPESRSRRVLEPAAGSLPTDGRTLALDVHRYKASRPRTTEHNTGDMIHAVFFTRDTRSMRRCAVATAVTQKERCEATRHRISDIQRYRSLEAFKHSSSRVCMTMSHMNWEQRKLGYLVRPSAVVPVRRRRLLSQKKDITAEWPSFHGFPATTHIKMSRKGRQRCRHH